MSNSSQVSLCSEPLAAAMAALPPMHAGERELVRERLLKLAGAQRYELVDFSFGDSELSWTTPRGNSTEEVATGYRGREADVILLDRLGRALATWEGEIAWSLLGLGQLASRERNDETAELTPLDELYLRQREV